MHPENELSASEKSRYSRHLVMPEVGSVGQQRLRDANVLVIGAGGLGSPILFYLAAAGVGKIGVVDGDVVDLTNLQRQILYATDDIGRKKTEVARNRIEALNPNVRVELFSEYLTHANVGRIFADYDLVLDGSDNFETRYLVNDACVLLQKPFVSGAVHRFEGQVFCFKPSESACYRCIFPNQPRGNVIQNCEQAGVLGVLPGLVGSLQATECLKLLLAMPGTLSGRLLLIDAAGMNFSEVKIARDSGCAICGVSPTITSIDTSSSDNHDNSCATTTSSITAHELREKLRGPNFQAVVIDVREPHEYSLSHLDGAINVPLSTFSEQVVVEISQYAEVILYCLGGTRSRKAAEWLKGSSKVRTLDLVGGIRAWRDAFAPEMLLDSPTSPSR